jgi:hypothetical protein
MLVYLLPSYSLRESFFKKGKKVTGHPLILVNNNMSIPSGCQSHPETGRCTEGIIHRKKYGIIYPENRNC